MGITKGEKVVGSAACNSASVDMEHSRMASMRPSNLLYWNHRKRRGHGAIYLKHIKIISLRQKGSLRTQRPRATLAVYFLIRPSWGFAFPGKCLLLGFAPLQEIVACGVIACNWEQSTSPMQLLLKDYRVSLSHRRLKYTHGKPGAAVINWTHIE